MNKYINNKKELLKIYESCVKGDINYTTLDSETIRILSILVTEDIKLHKAYINKKINEGLSEIEKLKKL